MTHLTVDRTAAPLAPERGDPDAILAAWQDLQARHHHLHTPDAARMLGLPEAALVAALCGTDAVRLQPDAARLLAPLAAWGRVLTAFSNACGVHMPLGAVALSADHAGGHLRLEGAHMRAAFDPRAVVHAFLLVQTDEMHGTTRSVQMFDASGDPVLKVFIFHKTRFAGARAHLLSLAHPDRSRVIEAAAARPVPAPAPGAGTGVDQDTVSETLAGALSAGEVRVEMFARHARAAWFGRPAHPRFAGGMLHLHEPSVRAHLRLAAIRTVERLSPGILVLGDGASPLLTVTARSVS